MTVSDEAIRDMVAAIERNTQAIDRLIESQAAAGNSFVEEQAVTRAVSSDGNRPLHDINDKMDDVIDNMIQITAALAAPS